MSVRDEIAKTARDILAMYGDQLTKPKGRIHAAENLTEALMPIVERVARDAAQLAISDRHSEAQERAIIDDIVRRVCGE